MTSWRCIHEGPGADAILVVDFGGRTGEVGFPGLARELASPASVYQCGPVKAALGHFPNDFLTALCKELPDNIIAVFGFCAGAGLVDSVVEAAGGNPVTVGFDPRPPTAAILANDFVRSARQLDDQLKQQELEQFAAEALSGRDLRAVAQSLGFRYAELAERKFTRDGVPAHLGDALIGRFWSLMVYLVAAAEHWPQPAAAHDLVVLPDRHEAVGVTGRPVRAATGRESFLIDPDVITALSATLQIRFLQSHPQVASVREVSGTVEVTVRPLTEHTVEDWQFLFDDMYDPSFDRDSTPDNQLVGWVDGLTGQPVPTEEMRAWVAASVDRIRGLNPRRVLEIGAGTGLIMQELLTLEGLVEYVGTDISTSAVQLLKALATNSTVPVRTYVCPADSPPASEDAYDLVILNSVVQYFPNISYFEEVIARSLELLAPEGHIFIGDLRDPGQLEPYYRQRNGRQSGGVFELEAAQRRDDELSLAPDYIRTLGTVHPAITAVEAAPRRGSHRNEMTLFRYDAILHAGCPTDLPATADMWWPGVPNARLTSVPGGLDPEKIWDLRGWQARAGCQPGEGIGSLEIWAAPPNAPGNHFTISRPHHTDPAEVDQSPLTPAGTWALLDQLGPGVRLVRALPEQGKT